MFNGSFIVSNFRASGKLCLEVLGPQRTRCTLRAEEHCPPSHTRVSVVFTWKGLMKGEETQSGFAALLQGKTLFRRFSHGEEWTTHPRAIAYG